MSFRLNEIESFPKLFLVDKLMNENLNHSEELLKLDSIDRRIFAEKHRQQEEGVQIEPKLPAL